MKIIWVHPPPTPYKMDTFNRLFTIFNGKMLFCGKTTFMEHYWNVDKLLKKAQFKYDFVKGWAFKRKKIRIHLPLFFHLLKEAPDIVISSEFTFQTFIVYLYCSFKRKKFLLLSETTLYTAKSYGMIRNLLRRWIIRKADACLAISELTKKYFKQLGVNDEKIFLTLYTIDMKAWNEIIKVHKKNSQTMKETLGINNKKVILYVGRLNPIKGVNFLLQSYKNIIKNLNNTYLLIIGEGPQRKELEEFVKKEEIKSVKFLGYVEPDELPIFYSIADIFVFPSLWDPFGMVVSEALASELPVICSKYAGASVLIKEGKNGFIIDPKDINKMTSLIIEIFLNQDLLQRLKKGAQASIQEFSIEKTIKGFISAINYIIKMKKNERIFKKILSRIK